MSHLTITRRRLALAAPLVTVALLTGACGSGDGATEVATLDESGGADATATTVAADADVGEAMLAYAQCMRDNGIDMEDPVLDADGNLSGGAGLFGPDSGIDPGSEEFQAAQEACGELTEGVQLGGPRDGFQAEDIQASLNEYTACLRDEGLEVDDITMPGPGGGPSGGPDSDSAAGATTDGATTGGDAPADGGFTGGPDGGGPGGGATGTGPDGGEGFDPAARMVEQLGLDQEDPEVVAAVETCQSILDDAFTPSADDEAGEDASS